MKTVEKLRLVLYILAAICFAITGIDAVQHHILNPLYALVTAADLCAVSVLTRQEKMMDQGTK